jgi:RecB family endonuclease NucS
MHSGLKRLSYQEYETLLRLYRESTPTGLSIPITNGTHPPIGAGGEGPQHLALKEYVSAHPSLVMGESDVTTYAVERGFPTGDRADIVLQDRFGRFIGLEVEVVVGNGDIIGALQSVKYRRMLEMVMGVQHGDGRAVLVAHSIAADVKKICASYDVECQEVPEEQVIAWRNRKKTEPV